MPITVSVTAEHISGGARGYADLCPIALALTQATNQDWSVAHETSERPFEGELFRFEPYYIPRAQNQETGDLVRLPDECGVFMDAFDAGVTPEPFAFEFAPEQKSEAL